MPWVGFEPTISAGERPKTYALDRTATGTGDTSLSTDTFQIAMGQLFTLNKDTHYYTSEITKSGDLLDSL